MLDIVVNHYAALAAPADVDYSVLVPFDSAEYYHDYCSIDYNDYEDTVCQPLYILIHPY